MSTPKLTASYVTLAGAGFAEPPRFTFRQRCEAASAAGFARIGVHLNDLKTLEPPTWPTFSPTTTSSSVRSNSSPAGPLPGPNRLPGPHWRRCGSWPYPPAAVIISVRVTSLAARWISTVPRRA